MDYLNFMAEKVLIIILAALVVVLASLIIIRKLRDRRTVPLKEEAVDELVAAIANNIREGAVQDIASRVSNILKKFLGCERILFLRYYKGRLEVNYLHGLIRVDRMAVSFKLTPEIQNHLKKFAHLGKTESLKKILPEASLKAIEALGLWAFFPVFLRENLYGVYFIKTSLPLEDRSLKFLSTALAFNLSAAYHIGIQEQQLKKFEERMRALQSSRDKTTATKAVTVEGGGEYRTEMPRLLRIKNCEKLVPELIAGLRKECGFSKMAFYVSSGKADDVVIGVNWNLSEDTDRLLRGQYGSLLSAIKTDAIVDFKNNNNLSLDAAEAKILKSGSLRYLTSLPWIEDKKALLLWNGDKSPEEVAEKLRRFRQEALPLIENAYHFEKMEALSYTDGLTGIHNFRYFRQRLEEELQRAKRYHRTLALMILDIDNLKSINDKYGHLAGDAILKAFGKILTKSVRAIDVASRYGGDEFCLIIPEADRDKALLFMERFRVKIASEHAAGEGISSDFKFSVSIGAAVYPEDAEDIDELINAADMALLQAKEEGGNLSRIYQPDFRRPGYSR